MHNDMFTAGEIAEYGNWLDSLQLNGEASRELDRLESDDFDWIE